MNVKELENFWNSQISTAPTRDNVSNRANSYFRADVQESKSPNSRTSSHLRWFTPQAQEYFQTLLEFSRLFNFKKRYKSRGKLLKQLARLVANGYGPGELKEKLNKIYNLQHHRDTYTRYLRLEIEPAMKKWQRHHAFMEQLLPDKPLGIRAAPISLKTSWTPKVYRAAIVAQKLSAKSNIANMKQSRKPKLP